MTGKRPAGPRPVVAGARHGTYAGYRRTCRCDPCTVAARAYETRRRRQTVYGRWQPYVPAAPVVAHIHTLRAAGLTNKTIAARAGISVGPLRRMLYGSPGRGELPSTRLRPQTARAILQVQPDLSVLPTNPRALLPAGPTKALVQGMVALGWPQAWIAEQIGRQGQLQVGTSTAPTVTVRNARLIADLAQQVGDRPGPSDRARANAGRLGWQTPAQQWAATYLAGHDPDLPHGTAVDQVLVQRAVDNVRAARPLHLPTAELEAAIDRLHTAGHSDSAIARACGCNPRTVLRHRAARDLPARTVDQQRTAA